MNRSARDRERAPERPGGPTPELPARRCAICRVPIPWLLCGPLCTAHRLELIAAAAEGTDPISTRAVLYLTTPVRTKGKTHE